MDKRIKRKNESVSEFPRRFGMPRGSGLALGGGGGGEGHVCRLISLLQALQVL